MALASLIREKPSGFLAEHVASTFVLVLRWWMESANPIPARRADEAFRQLVLPTAREAVRGCPREAAA